MHARTMPSSTTVPAISPIIRPMLELCSSLLLLRGVALLSSVLTGVGVVAVDIFEVLVVVATGFCGVFIVGIVGGV